MSSDRIGELKPCPFCGAGSFEIKLNGRVWTGQKYSEAVSVSVRHWCAPVAGQPARLIERVGRDEDSAVAAWNQRHVSVDGLRHIDEVSRAYRLDVFPEVHPDDWQRAREVLCSAGLSLDQISAANIRQVIDRVHSKLAGAADA